MQTPVKITFRHMTPSAALEAKVREHVQALARLDDRITACDVVIDAPAGRHVNGEPFDVRIHLTVPNGSFNVHHDRGHGEASTDAYAAVRAAFAALERMMKRHADERHRTRDHETIRRSDVAGA